MTPEDERAILTRLRARYPDHAVSDEVWAHSIRVWHARLAPAGCAARHTPRGASAAARVGVTPGETGTTTE